MYEAWLNKINKKKPVWSAFFFKISPSAPWFSPPSGTHFSWFVEIRIAVILSERYRAYQTEIRYPVFLVYLIDSSFLATVCTVDAPSEKPRGHRYRSSRVGYYHLCIRAGQQLGWDQIRSRCRFFLLIVISFTHTIIKHEHSLARTYRQALTRIRSIQAGTHSLNDLTSCLTSIYSAWESWETFFKQFQKSQCPLVVWN